MREIVDLVRAWRELEPNADAVLATVVHTTGSTYRRPGARMLITKNGWVAGSISGGCLESDLLSRVWQDTEKGPALVTYDSTADDDIVWGFGLGCNGSVTVLLQRVGTTPVLEVLASAVEERKAYTIETVISPGESLGRQVIRPQALSPVGYATNESGDELFTELILPPLPLVIFGRGFDVPPLVDAAQALGWFVTVVDHHSDVAVSADRVVVSRPEELGQRVDIDSRTAIVLMTHNYLRDLAILEQVLPSDAPYIGILGPTNRKKRLLAELSATPSDEQIAKVHGPVGLKLGAEGPAEIAVSVVSEILQFMRSRGGLL